MAHPKDDGNCNIHPYVELSRSCNQYFSPPPSPRAWNLEVALRMEVGYRVGQRVVVVGVQRN